LGCEVASARLAAELFSMVAAQIRAGMFDRAFLVARHALLRAEDAQCTARDVPYVPGPSYPRLETFDVEAAAWIQAWTVFGAAIRMVEDEDDILRGGAGQRSERPAGDGDFDFGLPEPEARPARSVREILTEATSPAALSMPVFPVMTHLPEPPKSVRDRGDSPRALAEPWAGKPMPLTPAPDPRVFVERLRARFPWAAEAIEAYAADLVGAPYARFSPRILVGPAGCGKTAFARAVLEAAGLDVTIYSAAGQMDGGSFAGTSRQWGSWRPSVPAQACLRLGKASHGLVVDEVEKAGDSRRWGRLDETLLPFLERGSTARAIHDPAFECALDLSPVSYVLTANALDGLAGPLRDRCQVLEWKAPRAEDLPVVAAAILDELRRERGLDDVWCPALSGDELDALTAWRGGSLRPLRRMVEAVLASRETFAPRH
ncbi:MAG: AAA family ATPase, partial [Methylobacteriaceae bacterium]